MIQQSSPTILRVGQMSNFPRIPEARLDHPQWLILILQLLQNPLSVLQISGIPGILQIPAAVPLSIVEKKLVSKLDDYGIGPWDGEDERHSSHDNPRCLKTNSNPKIGCIANFQNYKSHCRRKPFAA